MVGVKALSLSLLPLRRSAFFCHNAAIVFARGVFRMTAAPAIPTQGLRHVALNVTDVAVSVEFYTSLFGMQAVWQPDPENAYLSSGCDNLALHKAATGD